MNATDKYIASIIRPDPHTATDAQFNGYDAARSVQTIAGRLRKLADELEERAAPLTRGDGNAVSHAANVVNTFTQET